MKCGQVTQTCVALKSHFSKRISALIYSVRPARQMSVCNEEATLTWFLDLAECALKSTCTDTHEHAQKYFRRCHGMCQELMRIHWRGHLPLRLIYSLRVLLLFLQC